jgi:hypothetical protein
MRRITRWAVGGRAAIGAGLVVVALPVALLALGVVATHHEQPPAPHPRAHAGQAVADPAPARWDGPSQSSMNLLRDAVAVEAHRAAVAIGRCRARGSAGFRQCAFPALARAGAAGNYNSRALVALADEGAAPRECIRHVRALAGAAAMLGNASSSTLRHASGGARWRDVRAGSRWIRYAAIIVRRVAAARSWALACRPGPSGGVAAPAA